MKEKEIDAYIVPTKDPHGSEYVAEYYKGRSFISGFTGSAGNVVITSDRALLWTDGRYFIQAENELKGSEYNLMKMGEKDVPSFTRWLKDNLKDRAKLGFDGKLFSQAEVEILKKLLKEKDIELIDEFDLVGEVWKNRPELPSGKAYSLDKKYAGFTPKEKIEQVRNSMKEKDADIFLISSLDDIAWVFNLRGSDIAYNPVVISYAAITKDRALLFVDKEKIEEKVESFLNENKIEIKEYEEISNFIESLKDENVLLDKNRINRWLYKSLNETVKVIDDIDITTKLKANKNEIELENQRNAYVKDGVALVKFLHWIDSTIGKEEIDEISAAEKLEDFRREQDLFVEPSFNTISAYAANAAMAHYSATRDSFSVLEAKGLYLVDSGGQYLDGTTDITRTVSLGEITDEEKKDFTLTLKGHINLTDMKFLEGTNGYQLDAICRYPLWKEGFDYKHGTGHGVGFFLNVHEGPHRIANVPNDVVLEEGMVVSIEPGVYRASKHGIRIENIVAVKKDIKTEFGQFMSFETLSFVPIDLNCIDEKLLTESEKGWLNSYHSEVYEKLSPYLDGKVLEWLKEKTREI
ncbi:aminopeptidase P family protein [Tissierella creatinophila]|uniref:Aminopeptidase n=2 Tax=Tissierella creatinophila TaxID=79681 RepID=A0A1U7M7L6_TISCR|nr:aminopeptidase [Tissierella creatinophila DSM 6911]